MGLGGLDPLRMAPQISVHRWSAGYVQCLWVMPHVFFHLRLKLDKYPCKTLVKCPCFKHLINKKHYWCWNQGFSFKTYLTAMCYCPQLNDKVQPVNLLVNNMALLPVLSWLSDSKNSIAYFLPHTELMISDISHSCDIIGCRIITSNYLSASWQLIINK